MDILLSKDDTMASQVSWRHGNGQQYAMNPVNRDGCHLGGLGE